MPLFYEINGAVNKFSFGMHIFMLNLEASQKLIETMTLAECIEASKSITESKKHCSGTEICGNIHGLKPDCWKSDRLSS